MLKTPNHDEIAKAAYEIWQDEGCPDGCDQSHWKTAEARLTQTEKPGAAKKSAASKKPALKKAAAKEPKAAAKQQLKK